MKKAELASIIATQTGQQPERIVEIIDEFTKQIISRLATCNSLEVKQFGSFEVVTEPLRESHSARIPGKRIPSFKSDDQLTKTPAIVDPGIVQLVAAARDLIPETTAAAKAISMPTCRNRRTAFVPQTRARTEK